MLSREEFTEWIQENANPDPTNETWLISAASVVMQLAMNGELFKHEDIIEAMQSLAARMPVQVISVASLNMMNIQQQVINEIRSQN